MITRDLREMGRRDVYRVLSSLVVPRPIAWVTTLDDGGRVNLAPFSCFMGIFAPPMVAINVSRRADGSPKDTHKNLLERKGAVVHIADVPLLDSVQASGEEVPPEVSEVERLGLATAPSQVVGPPRLEAAPVALECLFRQEVRFDERAAVLFLDVLVAHAQDRIWDAGFDCARADRWEPLCRLIGGGAPVPNYAGLGERFTLGTPKLP